MSTQETMWPDSHPEADLPFVSTKNCNLWPSWPNFFEHIQIICFVFSANQIHQIWWEVHESWTSSVGPAQILGAELSKRSLAPDDKNGAWHVNQSNHAMHDVQNMCTLTKGGTILKGLFHSCPQRPHSLWSASRIPTSWEGPVFRAWVENQAMRLSDLTLTMLRVTGSLQIADFRCWTFPEDVFLCSDQKERGLWGRE